MGDRREPNPPPMYPKPDPPPAPPLKRSDRSCLYLSTDDLWVLKESLAVHYGMETLTPAVKERIRRLIDRCQMAIDRATQEEAS